jgi:hypothetical protein
MPGINRRGYFSKGFIEGREQKGIPCVFLSHSSKDKATVKLFAEYIKDRGVDVYFDEDDKKLQSAVAQDSHEEVVECIHDGLKKSTHAVCIMSSHTVESQWVPYEIGYSNSLHHPLALLPLAEVQTLPQFYKVAPVIETVSDLQLYLTKLTMGNRYITETLQKSIDVYGLSNKVLPAARKITYR